MNRKTPISPMVFDQRPELEAEDQTPKTSEVKNDSESELHLKRLWFLRKKYIREIKRSEWIYKPINTFLGLSGHTIRK